MGRWQTVGAAGGGVPDGKRGASSLLPGFGRQKPAGRLKNLESKTDAISRARLWIEVHEDAIVNELLEKGDPRTLLEVWRTVKAYAEGPPKQRIEFSTGPSPTEILMEIAERRRLAIPAQVVSDA